MADTGDDSHERNDHDGNATHSTSDASQVIILIIHAFVFLPAIIQLNLTNTQHYVSIGYNNMLDPINCDYQYFFIIGYIPCSLSF